MVEMFETKLRKIGNSMGIIIPSSIIEELGYINGDIIRVALPHSDLKPRNDLLKRIAGMAKGAKDFTRDREDRY